MNKRCLLILVGALLSTPLMSCSCSNDPIESSSIETFHDDRVDFIFHEDTSTYSFKMKRKDISTTEDIIIPETYNSYPVTVVEEDAFKEFRGVKKISLPSSIIKIGFGAFKECYGLEELVTPFVGETIVTNSYLGYMFGETSYKTYAKLPPRLNKVSFNKVNQIEDGAFYGLESLQEIEILDGTYYIGKESFYGCSNLTTFIVPSTINEVGKDAFVGCSSLSYKNYNGGLYLGNKEKPYTILVDFISSTTTLDIHDDCRAVELSSDLHKINRIHIGKNVSSIHIYSTEGYGSLNSISVKDGNKKYDSRNNCNAIIETNSNELIFGCQKTSIPRDVVSIKDGAFERKYTNGTIDTIIIPDSVISIGEGAFADCTGLRRIGFGEGLVSLPNRVCEGCKSLSIIELSKSIKSIGYDAFLDSRVSTIYFKCTEEEYNNGYITMDEDTERIFQNASTKVFAQDDNSSSTGENSND